MRWTNSDQADASLHCPKSCEGAVRKGRKWLASLRACLCAQPFPPRTQLCSSRWSLRSSPRCSPQSSGDGGEDDCAAKNAPSAQHGQRGGGSADKVAHSHAAVRSDLQRCEADSHRKEGESAACCERSAVWSANSAFSCGAAAAASRSSDLMPSSYRDVSSTSLTSAESDGCGIISTQRPDAAIRLETSTQPRPTSPCTRMSRKFDREVVAMRYVLNGVQRCAVPMGPFEVVGEGVSGKVLGIGSRVIKLVDDRMALLNEAIVTHLCSAHKNVVGLRAVVTDRFGRETGLVVQRWGQSLHAMRRQPALRDPRTQVHVMCQVARGAAYIHDLGYLHLDIKSQNILVREVAQAGATRMWAKICDFGLSIRAELCACDDARVALQGMGTSGYRAPEIDCVCAGQPVTLSADVYSLGVVMLELKLGRRVSDFDVLELQDNDPGLSGDLELEGLAEDQAYLAVVAACLRSEPARRPSMAEVASCLEELLRRHDAIARACPV